MREKLRVRSAAAGFFSSYPGNLYTSTSHRTLIASLRFIIPCSGWIPDACLAWLESAASASSQANASVLHLTRRAIGTGQNTERLHDPVTVFKMPEARYRSTAGRMCTVGTRHIRKRPAYGY